ncbi:MAG: hypothetical protein Q8P80_02155 [Candidatus Levybacteria bacterium]|nr:hypothetical protein [Candidatus Levybacteria bacterium]
MERPKIFSDKEIQFSNTILSRFKRKTREPTNETEKEPPYRRIILNRSGNLSNTTKLDQETADDYMRVSDMRKDIIIVDSEKIPERQAVRVGSDTLAFRAIEPIERLTQIILKSDPDYTLMKQDKKVEIQIHERVIDDKIRKAHPVHASDYKEQFLEFINKAVKSGLSESLKSEKLGYREQSTNYFGYAFVLPASIWNASSGKMEDIIYSAGIFYLYNICVNLVHYSDPSLIEKPFRPAFVRRSLKETLFLMLPLDKYIAGEYFLFRHGKNLIVP